MDEGSVERLYEDLYEKQYFGFSSTGFHSEVCSQVEFRIKDVLDEMEKAFVEQGFPDNIVKEQITNLFGCFKETAISPLKEVKAASRHIFAIPSNVLLNTDKYQESQYTDEQIAELEDEVAKLQQEYAREKYFLKRTNEEKQKVCSLIPIYEQTKDVIEVVKSIFKTKQEDEEVKQLLKGYRLLSNCLFGEEDNYEMYADEFEITEI